MQVATVAGGPIVCYLVQMGDGTHVLLDTGIPDNLQLEPDWPPSDLGPNVIEQLAMLGLQPDDISVLICTHFDVDHAGHHAAFTSARLVVQRAHYMAAQTETRFDADRPQWSHPALHYQLVDGDTELLPGLWLIETSGHVPGHQSVLVRLRETGLVLLVIDAVGSRQSFVVDAPDDPEAFNMDSKLARHSLLKLLDLVQREKVALVIFGHDAQQWQGLRKLPAYYA
jgi:N-acyl homoserine lactone hydrolase